MLIGRKEEKELLEEAYSSEESKFIAVYGRRRVGKTYLIRETFNNQFFFSYAGLAKGSAKKQIKNFCLSLVEQGASINEDVSDWLTAFSYLKRMVMASDKKKKVIFLDELSWMAGKRSADFLTALESFWNGWASGRKDILLIVSSSATSWLINHVIHNKGGLYHRLNHSIHLLPFSLKECREYSIVNELNYSLPQILELYMVFGGVPYYWSLLRRNLSVPQNVDSLCFARKGELHDEFSYLYASMFNNPDDYIKIITSISKKKKGLTRSEIITLSKIKDNGALSKKLHELEECGFIRQYMPYGKKKKESVFQLIDNFTIFYFSLMNLGNGDEHFYQNNMQSGLYNSFVGLSFELICLEHTDQIKFALGIPGVVSKECSWICYPNDEEGIAGHQIDLLIDRNDGIINMCEMKYSLSPYSVTHSEEKDYRQRISDFNKVTKNTKPIIFTMITPFGVNRNANAGIIAKTITLEDLMAI